MKVRRDPVWLFDLDNTLHDASHAAFRDLNERMSGYIVEHLGLGRLEADALRRHRDARAGAGQSAVSAGR